jgi:hypothetical protein
MWRSVALITVGLYTLGVAGLAVYFRLMTGPWLKAHREAQRRQAAERKLLERLGECREHREAVRGPACD